MAPDRMETKSMSEDLKTAGNSAMEMKGMDKDAESRPRSKKRKKISYLTVNKIWDVDYKDTALLKKFINERGKMLSSRQTGATASQQRVIAIAIKRAREMALIPFVVTEMSTERRERRTEAPVAAPAAE
jgi:small subunit ribosomal protein S18